MPVVNVASQTYPAWCELTRFNIIPLAAGESIPARWTSPQCKIVTVAGNIAIDNSGFTNNTVWNAPRDLAEEHRQATIRAGEHGAVFVLLEGDWSANTGGSGVFGVVESENPVNRGDAAPYPRTTSFDNHYHDCDEYWIVVEGAGTAVSEGITYDVHPGDCIITGAGDHHDFPRVTSPIRAVFFETTLLGQQRTGHLWEHTHGQAIPLRTPEAAS